jgi:hypothetical protein
MEIVSRGRHNLRSSSVLFSFFDVLFQQNFHDEHFEFPSPTQKGKSFMHAISLEHENGKKKSERK